MATNWVNWGEVLTSIIVAALVAAGGALWVFFTEAGREFWKKLGTIEAGAVEAEGVRTAFVVAALALIAGLAALVAVLLRLGGETPPSTFAQVEIGIVPPLGYSIPSQWKLNLQGGDQKDTFRRSYTTHVDFDRPFNCSPSVITSLNFIDATPGTSPPPNLRLEVKPVEGTIKPNGFDLIYSTWDTSLVWGVGVNWIAIERNCSAPSAVK